MNSKTIDVLAVLDAEIHNECVPGFVADRLQEARDAVADLVYAANAIAGPHVGIAPRDRKTHALRAALARVGGAA